MKSDYYDMLKLRRDDSKQFTLTPPPEKRIALLLDQCESGNLSAWWRLNREMTLEETSTHYGDDYKSDLTALPGWRSANALTRKRIVKVAKRYLLEQDPEVEKWLKSNDLYRPALAGYRALILLLKEDPNFISSLPVDVWKKWSPIIVAHPILNRGKELDLKLVKLAHEKVPDDIIDTLIKLIDKENRQFEHIYIIDRVKNCWDDRLAKALLNKAKEKRLKPKSMSCLLRELLDHRITEAKDFTESLIPLPPPSCGEERSRAIVAAQILINHAEDAGWSAVWPAFEQDITFCKDVVSAVAYGLSRDAANIGMLLTEDQLADLFILLALLYPYEEDQEKEEVPILGPRECIRMWTDSILCYLQKRGTYKACQEIQRIATELPSLDWLKWTLMKAKHIARQRTWIPPQPRDIIEMARNQQVRFVQSGDQLIDVILGSLEKIERKLHGERPDAHLIWNIIKGKYCRPIGENAFSDYIRNRLDEELRQKGVIFNREVRIHRGEKTDIHVDAITEDQRTGMLDSITCIIEVKGCWHQELYSAMKNQLVDRYMKDNHCQHGLYLIGWFNCDQWDNEDTRKIKAQKIGIEEAQKNSTFNLLNYQSKAFESRPLL